MRMAVHLHVAPVNYQGSGLKCCRRDTISQGECQQRQQTLVSYYATPYRRPNLTWIVPHTAILFIPRDTNSIHVKKTPVTLSPSIWQCLHPRDTNSIYVVPTPFMWQCLLPCDNNSFHVTLPLYIISQRLLSCHSDYSFVTTLLLRHVDPVNVTETPATQS